MVAGQDVADGAVRLKLGQIFNEELTGIAEWGFLQGKPYENAPDQRKSTVFRSFHLSLCKTISCEVSSCNWQK